MANKRGHFSTYNDSPNITIVPTSLNNKEPQPKKIKVKNILYEELLCPPVLPRNYMPFHQGNWTVPEVITNQSQYYHPPTTEMGFPAPNPEYPTFYDGNFLGNVAQNQYFPLPNAPGGSAYQPNIDSTMYYHGYYNTCEQFGTNQYVPPPTNFVDHSNCPSNGFGNVYQTMYGPVNINVSQYGSYSEIPQSKMPLNEAYTVPPVTEMASIKRDLMMNQPTFFQSDTSIPQSMPKNSFLKETATNNSHQFPTSTNRPVTPLQDETKISSRTRDELKDTSPTVTTLNGKTLGTLSSAETKSFKREEFVNMSPTIGKPKSATKRYRWASSDSSAFARKTKCHERVTSICISNPATETKPVKRKASTAISSFTRSTKYTERETSNSISPSVRKTKYRKTDTCTAISPILKNTNACKRETYISTLLQKIKNIKREASAVITKSKSSKSKVPTVISSSTVKHNKKNESTNMILPTTKLKSSKKKPSTKIIESPTKSKCYKTKSSQNMALSKTKSKFDQRESLLKKILIKKAKSQNREPSPSIWFYKKDKSNGNYTVTVNSEKYTNHPNKFNVKNIGTTRDYDKIKPNLHPVKKVSNKISNTAKSIKYRSKCLEWTTHETQLTDFNKNECETKRSTDTKSGVEVTDKFNIDDTDLRHKLTRQQSTNNKYKNKWNINHYQISPSKTKAKMLKSKRNKIKLVLNVTYNKPSAETDKIAKNDNIQSTDVDLSFLDDFNVDEIVDSLRSCENKNLASNVTNQETHELIFNEQRKESNAIKEMINLDCEQNKILDNVIEISKDNAHNEHQLRMKEDTYSKCITSKAVNNNTEIPSSIVENNQGQNPKQITVKQITLNTESFSPNDIKLDKSIDILNIKQEVTDKTVLPQHEKLKVAKSSVAIKKEIAKHKLILIADEIFIKKETLNEDDKNLTSDVEIRDDFLNTDPKVGHSEKNVLKAIKSDNELKLTNFSVLKCSNASKSNNEFKSDNTNHLSRNSDSNVCQSKMDTKEKVIQKNTVYENDSVLVDNQLCILDKQNKVHTTFTSANLCKSFDKNTHLRITTTTQKRTKKNPAPATNVRNSKNFVPDIRDVTTANRLDTLDNKPNMGQSPEKQKSIPNTNNRENEIMKKSKYIRNNDRGKNKLQCKINATEKEGIMTCNVATAKNINASENLIQDHKEYTLITTIVSSNVIQGKLNTKKNIKEKFSDSKIITSSALGKKKYSGKANRKTFKDQRHVDKQHTVPFTVNSSTPGNNIEKKHLKYTENTLTIESNKTKPGLIQDNKTTESTMNRCKNFFVNDKKYNKEKCSNESHKLNKQKILSTDVLNTKVHNSEDKELLKITQRICTSEKNKILRKINLKQKESITKCSMATGTIINHYKTVAQNYKEYKSNPANTGSSSELKENSKVINKIEGNELHIREKQNCETKSTYTRLYNKRVNELISSPQHIKLSDRNKPIKETEANKTACTFKCQILTLTTNINHSKLITQNNKDNSLNSSKISFQEQSNIKQTSEEKVNYQRRILDKHSLVSARGTNKIKSNSRAQNVQQAPKGLQTDNSAKEFTRFCECGNATVTGLNHCNHITQETSNKTEITSSFLQAEPPIETINLGNINDQHCASNETKIEMISKNLQTEPAIKKTNLNNNCLQYSLNKPKIEITSEIAIEKRNFYNSNEQRLTSKKTEIETICNVLHVVPTIKIRNLDNNNIQYRSFKNTEIETTGNVSNAEPTIEKRYLDNNNDQHSTINNTKIGNTGVLQTVPAIKKRNLNNNNDQHRPSNKTEIETSHVSHAELKKRNLDNNNDQHRTSKNAVTENTSNALLSETVIQKWNSDNNNDQRCVLEEQKDFCKSVKNLSNDKIDVNDKSLFNEDQPKNSCSREKVSPVVQRNQHPNPTCNHSPSNKNQMNQKYADNIIQALEKILSPDYRVASVIHRGSFSTLYHCKDQRLNSYAVKMLNILNHNLLGGPKEKLLFRIQNERSHGFSACLQSLCCFTIRKHWCFIMEYYPKNLNEALYENNKPFHIDQIQNLARQLVKAVLTLKKNNIVHADIKPHHILLNSSNDNLKLCGFDASNYINDMKLLSNIGSLNYRAPEIILCYSLGFGIDVWSTAAVLYEMATNEQLFSGTENNNAILHRQMCLLRSIPRDMIYKSLYGKTYFEGIYFVRQIGRRPQNRIMINTISFTKNNRIRNNVYNAYYTHWSKLRTIQQAARDSVTIGKFCELLYQMLELHPRNRIPIEFVHCNRFIYENNYYPN